ncbi:MAG: folate-binding protein YgfZ [Planctomycetes bacterium]|nr:folate-binding protein YgfZ [Planctomycetota bacterium]
MAANQSPFDAQISADVARTVVGRTILPARFGPAADEYHRVRKSCGLFDRSDRGLLVVSGPDRKVWLHNVVSNAVRTLDDNAGAYAFALDLRGRVLFDLSILVLADRLWLDIDESRIEAAIAHFNRYLIIEKAEVANATAQWARLGVAGPTVSEVAARLGVGNFAAWPALQSVWLEPDRVRLIRHDFAGLPGLELVLPREAAGAWWARLADECGIQPAGQETLDALRIESGIPWYGRDIDERTIGPETGQIERAISYNKGCYLGQEVIERMRSHASLARRLVRVRMVDGSGLAPPVAMQQQDREVGQITSLVPHPLGQSWIGLGYLRTAVMSADGLAAGGRAVEVAP